MRVEIEWGRGEVRKGGRSQHIYDRLSPLYSASIYCRSLKKPFQLNNSPQFPSNFFIKFGVQVRLNRNIAYLYRDAHTPHTTLSHLNHIGLVNANEFKYHNTLLKTKFDEAE